MNFKEKTDTELATLLIRDNEAAFSELYVRYKDKLYYFCLHLLKSKEEANDIVQEIFIRLWESRSFINPELSFSSFLYTMARNRILNYFRDIDIDEKVKQILSAQKITEEEAIDSKIIYTEYQMILQNAISQLPPQRQKIFNMSRIESMSHKEIAALLEMTTKGVEFHISKSTRALRLALKDYLPVSLLFFYLN